MNLPSHLRTTTKPGDTPPPAATRDVLPYGRQWIVDDDLAAVMQALRDPLITQGPVVAKFERQVADYCQARHAVAFANGTAALHAACFAAHLRPDDEAITCTLSFVASANCIAYLGATPVLADIDPKTRTIDVADIDRRIDKKTRAIIPVDFSGLPCDLEDILRLARQRNLVVIEDACHALGAKYHHRRVGAIADMTVFSFHPVKHITTGEGGMVLTNREDFDERLRLFRNHGITRDEQRLPGKPDPWYYEMHELGYNYRITDFQCALGLSQMARLEQFVARRHQIAELYYRALGEFDELILPHEPEDRRSSYHIYPIEIREEQLTVGRREIFQALCAAGLGVQVHYIPIHLQPYYRRKYGYREGDYPHAELYYRRAVTLPLFPAMTDDDVRFVVTALAEILTKYRRRR